jgi:hypothetical protein
MSEGPPAAGPFDRSDRAFDRTRALLAASQSFTDTVTVEDVGAGRRAGAHGTAPVLRRALPARSRRATAPDARHPDPAGQEATKPWLTYDLSTAIPTATAVRLRRLVAYEDRPSFKADHPNQSAGWSALAVLVWARRPESRPRI